MSERWLPVVGYEGVYEVSDDGRVRRVGAAKAARVGRICRPSLNPVNGYMYAYFSRQCRTTARSLHRVVADAFLGPCPEGKEVNHKDRDRTNNRLANLEYVTSKENKATAHKRFGETIPWSKLTVAAVREIRASTEIYPVLARKFGVSISAICSVNRGRTWRHVQ